MFTNNQAPDYSNNFLTNYGEWGNSLDRIEPAFFDTWKTYRHNIKSPEAIKIYNDVANKFDKKYRILSPEEEFEQNKKWQTAQAIRNSIHGDMRRLEADRKEAEKIKVFHPNLDISNDLDIYDLALNLEKEFGDESVIPSSNFGRAFRNKMAPLSEERNKNKQHYDEQYRTGTNFAGSKNLSELNKWMQDNPGRSGMFDAVKKSYDDRKVLEDARNKYSGLMSGLPDSILDLKDHLLSNRFLLKELGISQSDNQDQQFWDLENWKNDYERRRQNALNEERIIHQDLKNREIEQQERRQRNNRILPFFGGKPKEETPPPWMRDRNYFNDYMGAQENLHNFRNDHSYGNANRDYLETMLKTMGKNVNPYSARVEAQLIRDPQAMKALESMLPAYVAMRNQLNQGAEGEQPRYIPRPQRRDRFKHVMSNFAPENFQAGLDPNAQYLPYHLRRNT